MHVDCCHNSPMLLHEDMLCSNASPRPLMVCPSYLLLHQGGVLCNADLMITIS